MSLTDAVALVAGATRGAGRGISIELGRAGATVYVTGRSSRSTGPSAMGRAETIEETAELVEAAGGIAVAVRVDHSEPEEVRALIERIGREQDGRLDVLVNDVWGGDPLTEWGTPFWRQPLDRGLALLRQAVETHLITSWFAAALMVARHQGLILEITDGISTDYRGSFYYDLAKASVIRMGLGLAADLEPDGVTALALTPGFLRSEAVLDHFGVQEASWRDAIEKDPHFAASETVAFIGRAVVALASDPDVARWRGQAVATWQLAKVYGFVDADGTQPDWGTYFDTQ
jgi:NAD(P)-dependent dehydrogenase (short-subunit alcohol dehydrogenase family)